jgi:hypothetical protein
MFNGAVPVDGHGDLGYTVHHPGRLRGHGAGPGLISDLKDPM